MRDHLLLAGNQGQQLRAARRARIAGRLTHASSTSAPTTGSHLHKSELSHINSPTAPALATLSQQVSRTRRPRLLRQGREEIAVLMPLPASPRRRKTGVVRPDDSLVRLIGIGRGGIPGGIAVALLSDLARRSWRQITTIVLIIECGALLRANLGVALAPRFLRDIEASRTTIVRVRASDETRAKAIIFQYTKLPRRPPYNGLQSDAPGASPCPC